MNSAVSDTRRALVAAGAPDPIKITYGGLLRWEVPSTIPGPMEKEA